MIPSRKNTHRGFYRNHTKRFFKLKTYHKRSLVETVISCIKRRYGGHVASHTARTQRAEIKTRFIIHNLRLVPKTETFN